MAKQERDPILSKESQDHANRPVAGFFEGALPFYGRGRTATPLGLPTAQPTGVPPRLADERLKKDLQ